eukprot:g28526.t1
MSDRLAEPYVTLLKLLNSNRPTYLAEFLEARRALLTKVTESTEGDLLQILRSPGTRNEAFRRLGRRFFIILLLCLSLAGGGIAFVYVGRANREISGDQIIPMSEHRPQSEEDDHRYDRDSNGNLIFSDEEKQENAALRAALKPCMDTEKTKLGRKTQSEKALGWGCRRPPTAEPPTRGPALGGPGTDTCLADDGWQCLETKPDPVGPRGGHSNRRRAAMFLDESESGSGISSTYAEDSAKQVLLFVGACIVLALLRRPKRGPAEELDSDGSSHAMCSSEPGPTVIIKQHTPRKTPPRRDRVGSITSYTLQFGALSTRPLDEPPATGPVTRWTLSSLEHWLALAELKLRVPYPRLSPVARAWLNELYYSSTSA